MRPSPATRQNHKWGVFGKNHASQPQEAAGGESLAASASPADEEERETDEEQDEDTTDEDADTEE